MSQRFFTQAELAKYTGRSKQYIHKLKTKGEIVLDDATGKIDAHHPVNSMTIEAMRMRDDMSPENQAPPAGTENIDTSQPPDPNAPETMKELYRSKLEWERERTREQARKLQIDNAKEVKDLVPIEVVEMMLGAFGAGIRSNFLTIPKRIGRGDVDLERRIEKAISRGIVVTRDNALKVMQKHIDEIITQKELDEKGEAGLKKYVGEEDDETEQ